MGLNKENNGNVYPMPNRGHINAEKPQSIESEGCDSVDWQEKYIEKLNQDVSDIKADMKSMDERVGKKIDTKLEEFRNEMRHLDNQRAEDMREIRNSLESTNKHVQSIAVTTNIGVAAMVIAVIVGVCGIWYSVQGTQNDIGRQLQQTNMQVQELQKNK